MKKIGVLFLTISLTASLARAGQPFRRCSVASLSKAQQEAVEADLSVVRSLRGHHGIPRSGNGLTGVGVTPKSSWDVFWEFVQGAPGLDVKPLVIPVHIHVITTGGHIIGSEIDDAGVQNQIDIMNRAYKSAKISFAVADIDRTTNTKWKAVEQYSNTELEMKKALNRGDATELNLYIVDTLVEGALGYSSFPWEYAAAAELDGVVVARDSLPGGMISGYNMGYSAVHETGHWLGLYHTFQGECSSGDQVDDTPAQAWATMGCPSQADDSCPDDDGLDPIHNFMDYSTDICMTEFSRGQALRMHDSWATYRADKSAVLTKRK